jgi:hypothetical protein
MQAQDRCGAKLRMCTPVAEPCRRGCLTSALLPTGAAEAVAFCRGRRIISGNDCGGRSASLERPRQNAALGDCQSSAWSKVLLRFHLIATPHVRLLLPYTFRR